MLTYRIIYISQYKYTICKNYYLLYITKNKLTGII
jgi:hypothetical protein